MKTLIERNTDKFTFYEKDSGYDVFKKFWVKSSNHILKLETRQIYLGEDSFDFFVNGDLNAMVNDIAEFWADELNGTYRKIKNREVDFLRLHVVDFPLTDYLKSEFYSYIVSSRIGEQIKYVESNSVCSEYTLLDFVIFDNLAIMITEYNENNEVVGDWFLEDQTIINKISCEFFSLFDKGKDYRGMYNSDNAIEALLLAKMRELSPPGNEL